MDLPIENGDFPYVSLPEGISTNLGVGLGQQNGDRQHNVNKFLKSNMIPPPPPKKRRYFCVGSYSGWWFQTFFIFHFIYGMSSFPLTFIFFRRVAQPPTISFHNMVYFPLPPNDILFEFHVFSSRQALNVEDKVQLLRHAVESPRGRTLEFGPWRTALFCWLAMICPTLWLRIFSLIISCPLSYYPLVINIVYDYNYII